jgi:putative FmdB family regulatory protein
MPIYDYECQKCNHTWDAIESFSAPPNPPCPQCRSKKTHRLISAAAFHLKGGGWYSSGYSKAGAASGDSAAAAPASTASTPPSGPPAPSGSDD